MSKQIKIGTQVRMSPKCRFAQFHKEKMGLSGTVVGKWGKSYTVDFGGHGQVNLEPQDMIISSSRPRGYSHPHAPDADRVHRFTQRLHGSGIDADWKIQETKSSIRASNSYHAMNESGMYDRWIDFTVIFPKGEPMDNFKLQFGDSYGAKKYMLGDYLGDTIAYTLNELGL